MDIENQPESEIVEPQAVVDAPADQSQDDYDPAEFYADDNADQTEGDAEPSTEADEPEVEPIDAPASWAKDAKETFAKLPREAQEIIATRERDRESFLTNKSMEAARTRQVVETEARQALMTIMQNHEQKLQPLLSQFETAQPDLRLLNSNDPAERDLYFQQEAQYRYGVAQREHIAQQLEETQQHAAAIAQQQSQAELQAEHEMLESVLKTEWSEPSARAKLLADLQPIAAELGYPAELMAQARGVDILAMKQAHSWKQKADKYDALNKRKMEPVRAARGIPPAARAASPQTGRGQPVDAAALLYPNDVRRN